MRIGLMGDREPQSTNHVAQEPPGVVGRPLTDQEGGNQLGSLVQGGPKVDIPDIGPLPVFFHGQPALFLEYERPHFVQFQVL
jgi:hypothetical protein